MSGEDKEDSSAAAVQWIILWLQGKFQVLFLLVITFFKSSSYRMLHSFKQQPSISNIEPNVILSTNTAQLSGKSLM